MPTFLAQLGAAGGGSYCLFPDMDRRAEVFPALSPLRVCARTAWAGADALHGGEGKGRERQNEGETQRDEWGERGRQHQRPHSAELHPPAPGCGHLCRRRGPEPGHPKFTMDHTHTRTQAATAGPGVPRRPWRRGRRQVSVPPPGDLGCAASLGPAAMTTAACACPRSPSRGCRFGKSPLLPGHHGHPCRALPFPKEPARREGATRSFNPRVSPGRPSTALRRLGLPTWKRFTWMKQ